MSKDTAITNEAFAATAPSDHPNEPLTSQVDETCLLSIARHLTNVGIGYDIETHEGISLCGGAIYLQQEGDDAVGIIDDWHQMSAPFHVNDLPQMARDVCDPANADGPCYESDDLAQWEELGRFYAVLHFALCYKLGGGE